MRLLSVLFLVCLVAACATSRNVINPPDNIFKAQTSDPLLQQVIADFQEVCLPFVLHESRVERRDDVSIYKSKIAKAGYVERDLTQQERLSQQNNDPSPHYAFQKSDPRIDLEIYCKWLPSAKLYDIPHDSNPGQKCHMNIEMPENFDFQKLELELLRHDPDWIEVLSSNFKNVRQQCVVFEGRIYLLTIIHRNLSEFDTRNAFLTSDSRRHDALFELVDSDHSNLKKNGLVMSFSKWVNTKDCQSQIK